MTEREALLAAVSGKPDDDLPRLVFADWLDENGEPTRAEFVRLQIERARNPDRFDLVSCQTELLADPNALLDPIDRDAFELAPYRPLFTRGFLPGAQFPNFDPDHFDPPIYPVEDVADDWHRLCDQAARQPMFERVESPGWLEVAVAGLGRVHVDCLRTERKAVRPSEPHATRPELLPGVTAV